MAKNVIVAGATYPDVPAITLPKAGGGTARFVDEDDAPRLVVTEEPDEHGGTVLSITGEELKLQHKTVTPSETAQEIAPDTELGYTALSKVKVESIPSDYVGSEVPRDPTPTISGRTVTIPPGLYSEQQTKDVAAVEQATPVISIDADGKISAKATQGAGYVAAGSKTGTKQLTKRTAADLSASGPTVTAPAGYYPEQVQKAVPSATQATPSIAVDANGLITATATQGAGYVAAGSKTGTLQLPTKAAATITPGTTAQEIAAGTYLTGKQTVPGCADLKGENILAGHTIFNVPGSLVVHHIYVGTGAPSASLGEDGDIYIQIGG